jgi:hypothetical protein
MTSKLRLLELSATACGVKMGRNMATKNRRNVSTRGPIGCGAAIDLPLRPEEALQERFAWKNSAENGESPLSTVFFKHICL